MHYYLNRTLCDVLDEMRKCNKTRNYAPLLGLIEEAQIMGNKMEAKLNSIKDIESIETKLNKLRKELKKHEKQNENE